MVLSHPVQTWAIIPIIMREIAEVGRDAPTYDYCPLASNKYRTSDIPHCLSNVIESQSKALFAKLEMTDYAAVHKTFFTATHTIGNEKVIVQATKGDGLSVLVWYRFYHEITGYTERAKLRDFLHVLHGGFVKCGDPSKFISEKLEKYIEKAKQLKIRIDYDATVKRIALVLKKRDPATFMQVSARYDQCHDPAISENALGALEAFLSEIVHTACIYDGQYIGYDDKTIIQTIHRISKANDDRISKLTATTR
eukprot:SAG31_NODE_500_length_14835_cov_22.409338_3_plen_252_part_00